MTAPRETQGSPGDAFLYRGGWLHCENSSLVTLAHEFGTPLYVYSQSHLLENATRLLSAASSFDRDCLVCYAVKANGNPEIMRSLAGLGMGADVTSAGELFLALRAGFEPGKIVFSGVGKTRDEIRTALSAGIRGLHVESEMELSVISQLARSMEKVAHISLRVNPDVQVDTHRHISTGRSIHKFGVSLGQARELLLECANDDWLLPVGLSVHIGSQIRDLRPLRLAVEQICELALRIEEQGVRLRYLDAGGGLGIDYDGTGAPSLKEWAEIVSRPIAEAGYDVVLEPGRSVIGTAGILLTSVIYTKVTGRKRFIIIDAGMNDLLRPSLYNAFHPIATVREQQLTDTSIGQKRFDIVGPVCETGDSFAESRSMPPVEPGDLLAIMHAGAYGFAMSSNYNGRLRPAEVMVRGSRYHLIRRRETLDDLTHTVPPDAKLKS